MNVDAAGPVIAGSRQLQDTFPIIDSNHILHTAFAPCAFSDNGGSLVVLQTGT